MVREGKEDRAKRGKISLLYPAYYLAQYTILY
jgi:hypothetical protein